MTPSILTQPHFSYPSTVYRTLPSQLYALAADCSIGRAGSAILMTTSQGPGQGQGLGSGQGSGPGQKQGQGQGLSSTNNDGNDANDASQLALIYLKLLPLTGNSDVITHFLCVQIDLPLTQVVMVMVG